MAGICHIYKPAEAQTFISVTYIPPSTTRERMRASRPAWCRFTASCVSTTLRPLQPTFVNRAMDGRENSWRWRAEGWVHTEHHRGLKTRPGRTNTHMSCSPDGPEARVWGQEAHGLCAGVLPLLQDVHVLRELGSLICHPADNKYAVYWMKPCKNVTSCYEFGTFAVLFAAFLSPHDFISTDDNHMTSRLIKTHLKFDKLQPNQFSTHSKSQSFFV